jgi:hypothetical protein
LYPFNLMTPWPGLRPSHAFNCHAGGQITVAAINADFVPETPPQSFAWRKPPPSLAFSNMARLLLLFWQIEIAVQHNFFGLEQNQGRQSHSGSTKNQMVNKVLTAEKYHHTATPCGCSPADELLTPLAGNGNFTSWN